MIYLSYARPVEVKKLTTVSTGGTKDVPPFDFDKTFPILDQSISCPASGPIPALNAKLHIDAEAKVHAVVTFGYAVTGTIVPPHIDDLGIFAGKLNHGTPMDLLFTHLHQL